jgi:hypothetical protein
MGIKKHIAANSKFYIILLIVLGSIGILGGGYYLYSYLKRSAIDPLAVIPKNAVLIIDIKDPQASLNTLMEENNIWQHFMTLDTANTFQEQLHFIDSLIFSEANFAELVKNNRSCISIHYTGQDKLSLLFAVSIESRRNGKKIRQFISNHVGEKEIKEEKHKGETIYSIDIKGMPAFNYTIAHGVFMASYNSLLLKDAIVQAKSDDGFDKDPAFLKLQETAGEKVEANVYVHMNFIGRMLATAFKDAYRSDLSELEKMGVWAEMDLVLKENEILLNGFLLPNNKEENYLAFLHKQKAQKTDVQKLIPADAAAMMLWAMDDFQTFYKDWNGWRLKNAHHKDIINSFKSQYGDELIHDFTSWIGNQFAFFVLSSDSVDLYAQSYAIFKSKDAQTAKLRLSKYVKDNDSASFRGFEIMKLKPLGIIPVLFGSVFSNIEETNCLIMEDYVVFANTENSLKRMVNSYLAGKTLVKTEVYTEMSEKLSEESNFFAYLNCKYSFKLMQEFIRDEYLTRMLSNPALYTSFESVAFQISSAQELFYTSFYLKYAPGQSKETDYVWETVLDADIISEPFLIWDHQTKNYAIVVFDKHNYMYLINIKGEVLWKIPLAEKPMSKVYYVDCYKNDKYQYLFNTANYIYLIDKNGEKVENYPVKLEASATSPLALFDYDKDKNYRILISCADRKLYNYSIDGMPTNGWENPSTKDFVRCMPMHIRLGHSDYILLAEADGSLPFFNRRGQELEFLNEYFVNASQTAVYPDEKEMQFVTTDENGVVIRIGSDGNLTKKIIQDFSPDHSFIYQDVNGDEEKDYIFYDKKQLFVYEKNGEALFKHGFTKSMDSEIRFTKGLASKPIISLNSTDGELFLFDAKGLIPTEIKFHSHKPASFFKEENSLNVFTVYNNKVYYYMIGEE